MKERDWTVFKRVHGLALDRYCRRVLAEAERIMSHKHETAHERYLTVSEIMRKHDREIREIFDDFRRSTAKLQLLRMVAEKLVTEQELAEFSPEVRETIEHLVGTSRE